jgi:hypothetical protein
MICFKKSTEKIVKQRLPKTLRWKVKQLRNVSGLRVTSSIVNKSLVIVFLLSLLLSFHVIDGIVNDRCQEEEKQNLGNKQG